MTVTGPRLFVERDRRRALRETEAALPSICIAYLSGSTLSFSLMSTRTPRR